MLLAEEILHCPRCGEVLVREPQDFWKCPQCGGEWWDDSSKLAEMKAEERSRVLASELRQQMLWSLSKQYTPVLPPVVIIDPNKRSGSRSGRKRKKEKLKPLLMSERHYLA